jgi:EAL domain-containing protein (putative c-di-GMP-specific phosphodiesterase class I)
MAKSLELVVLAEGVEEKEQLAFLNELNCSLFQGYFFSEPLPAEELAALVHSGEENRQNGGNTGSA